MTKNLDLNGLQSIADNYDLFYIDLWGVVHNGVNLHEKAIAVINELLKKKKMLVLLTNAPRPNKTVQNFLEKMGMDKVLRDYVFTSGDGLTISGANADWYTINMNNNSSSNYSYNSTTQLDQGYGIFGWPNPKQIFL